MCAHVHNVHVHVLELLLVVSDDVSYTFANFWGSDATPHAYYTHTGGEIIRPCH